MQERTGGFRIPRIGDNPVTPMRITGVTVVLLLAALSTGTAATEIQLSQTTLGDLAPPYRLRTSVASNERGYVVAWEATADPVADVTSIYIRVLGADGVPLRPFPTFLGLGREPRAVWNGHEYLVVWGITSPTSGPLFTPSVVGMRLREDGSLIDTQPVTLVSEVNPFSDLVAVAWNGSQYLVTWRRGMALVDADLQRFRLVLLPSIGGNPIYSATYGGSFMVLSQVHSGSSWKLVVLPVSAAGELGELYLLDGVRGNIIPFDTGYAVMWDDETNLHAGRLFANGTIRSSSIIGLGPVGFPRLAARDGRLVASWESIPDNSHTRVCMARFDLFLPPVCSAVSAGLQHDPSIGTSTTSILAAWSDRTNSSDSVRVAVSQLNNLPQVEAGAGRIVSIASPMPAAEKRTDGSIAVAWSEYNQSTKHFEIHLGGRSSQGAALTERSIFADALDQTSPAISAGAGRTMVLWEEGPAESSKIRMTIIDDATKAVIATLPLAAGSAPSVAFDGKEWLTAWQSPSGVIRFAVINKDGNAISSGAMPTETFAASFQTAPAAAWSGKTFLVTWREAVAAGSGSPPGERIEVATVVAGGVTSPARTLGSADAGLSAPSVAASGGRLLVSWGTPEGLLRQVLLDGAGKEINEFELVLPYPVARTRTHGMPGGFATLGGSRIALTSSEGGVLDAFDVPEAAAGGDFAVDAANRVTLVYSRSIGNALIATFAQTVGLPRRRASNH